MVHPPKRDPWVRCILFAVIGLEAVLGVVFLGTAVLQAAPVLLLPGLLMVGVAFGLGRIFSATSYELTPTHLVVRLWPLRWRVPLDAIVEVVPRNDLSPELSWGLAWSLDRLLIHYRKANGRRAMPLAIAPADKVAFLRELTEAVPALVVTDEGTFRVPSA